MPDVTAQAPDGTVHSFPQGTDPAVVDGVMKQYIGQSRYDAFVNRPDPAWNNAVGGYQKQYFSDPTDKSIPNLLLQQIQSMPGTYERLDALNKLSPNLSDVGKAAILQQAMQNRGQTGASIGVPPASHPNGFQQAMSGVGNAMSSQKDALAAAVQPLDFAAKQRYGGLQATGDPSIDAATDFTSQQALANMPFLQRLAALRGQPLNALGQPNQQVANNQAGHALNPLGQSGNALFNLGGQMAVDPLTWETLGMGTLLHGLAAAAPEGSLAARAAAIAPRAVSTGFAAATLPPALSQLYQGIKTGDVGETTQGVAGAAFGGLAGLHALGAFGGAPPVQAETPIPEPVVPEPIIPPVVPDVVSPLPVDPAVPSAPPVAVTPPTGIQPEQVSALAQDGFTKAADLFAQAKAADPTLTRQQFAQQLYDFHATNAGDGGAFEYEAPSGNAKPADVFTAKSADGQNIRYYGFSEKGNVNAGTDPGQPNTGSPNISNGIPQESAPEPQSASARQGEAQSAQVNNTALSENGGRSAVSVNPGIEQGFNLAHYDEVGEAKEALRDYLKTQAAPIADARGYVSRTDTAAAAARNGVTESQLNAAVPGAGAEELNALGNLHDQYFRDWQTAAKAFNESGSDADLRAMTEAKLQLDSFTALLAGKEAEAGRSLGALNNLKSAEYAKDPVKAAVAEVMKPIRQGKNAAPLDPTKEGFGSKNTLFEKSSGEAALQRIREAVKGGQKLSSGTDPTGGKFDNVDVKDLLEAGGYLFEGGLRKFAEWSKGMTDAVGAQLTDGQLQHTWANLRAEFTQRVSTKRTSDTFVDQLSQRQGWSRQAAANFVNDIGHDTLNKLLTGEARTPEEEKAIGQAYIDHQKGGPKQGTVSSGTIGDVLAARDKVKTDIAKEQQTPDSLAAKRLQSQTNQLTKRLSEITAKVDAGDTSVKKSTPPVDTPEQAIIRNQIADKQTQLDAMRKAERDAAKPPKPQPGAPTLQDRFETEMTRKMGKDAFSGFKKQLSPDAYKALLDGTMTDAHEGEIKQALKDNPRAAPKNAAPELTGPRKAVDAMSKELADEKRETARQEREAQRAGQPKPERAAKTPEEQSDAFWKRRVGGKLDAFKKEVGPDILRKFQNDDPLSLGETRTLGERLLANQEPRVKTTSEASERLSDVVKETHKALSDQEIDLRRGNTPRDIATKLLLDQGRGDAKRVAAKMAGIDDNDIEGLRRVVREESKVSPARTAVALWKAGLLTSPRTIAKVLGSHTISLGVDELSAIPTSITDGLVSQVTGRRSMSGISLRQAAASAYKAATQGLVESLRIVRHGEENANIQDLGGATSKHALFELPQSNSKVMQGYMDLVGNVHAAAYRTARLYAFTRAMASEANFYAKNEVSGGHISADQLQARVKQLMDNPTEEMSANAALAAEKAVYLNDNKLTRGTRAFKSEFGDGAKALVDFLFPFQKVSSNIALKYYQHLPGPELVRGIMQAVGKSKQGGGMSVEAQKNFSETIGKQVTGIGLTALGAYLASKGLMTGYGKRDDGKPEHSVKMLGRWWDVSGIAPYGPIMAVGGTVPSGGKALAEGVIKGATENPVSRTAETISRLQEQGGGGVVQSLAGSIVPKGLSDLAGEMDDQKRKAGGYIVQPVQKGIPGLRNRLQGTGKPETNTLFDPTNSVRVR